MVETNFLRLLSETIHSTSSSLQLVQGLCSTTLQRTFRARQDWQAFDALLLTLLCTLAPVAGKPASLAFLFALGDAEGLARATSTSPLTEVSDMIKSSNENEGPREKAWPGGRGVKLTFVLTCSGRQFAAFPHDPLSSPHKTLKRANSAVSTNHQSHAALAPCFAKPPIPPSIPFPSRQ